MGCVRVDFNPVGALTNLPVNEGAEVFVIGLISALGDASFGGEVPGGVASCRDNGAGGDQ